MTSNGNAAPLRLSDEQLMELLRLARPLSPDSRDVLLQLIAQRFGGRTDVGDGELFRSVRECIKEHRLFDAPDLPPESEAPSRGRRRAEGKYA